VPQRASAAFATQLSAQSVGRQGEIVINWEAIGAVGEVAGAVAVLVTLVYLATQIRQNTKSTRAMIYSATTQGWHEYLQQQSVRDVDLLANLSSDPEQLSNAEFYRAYYLCRVIFRRMEHDYYQFCNGTFEAETWVAYVRSFREDTFQNRAVRAMWELQSDYFDPKFAEYMQVVVREAGANPVPNLRRRFMEQLQQKKTEHGADAAD
jgi:hypothetical protein